MKIRVHGTEGESSETIWRLGQVLGLLSVSQPYPDRGKSSLVRVYIEASLDLPPDPTGSATTPARVREIAARADALAAEIASLKYDLRSADDEPVRRSGFRCDTTIGWVRQAARELLETAADLDRIAIAAAPGTCSIPWGVCPEHGNTLASTGGKTWCRRSGCGQTWDYDRGGLPCTEPARWMVTDQHGTGGVMCDGHAQDARERLDAATVAPLDSPARTSGSPGHTDGN